MASRSEAREHETTKSPNFDSSRRDTTSALLRKRHFTRTEVRISHASAYFTCPKGKFHCAAPAVPRSGIPSRSVKDCRVGRKKCALLAMTRLIGFAGKRNGFQNETFEKRCRAEQRRAERPHKAKTSVSPKNVSNLCHCEAALRPWQS